MSEATGAVERHLGVRPVWALQLDVSGRIDGHREVLEILPLTLARGGCALDDYPDKTWTLDELLTDADNELRRVFLRPTYTNHHDESSPAQTAPDTLGRTSSARLSVHA